MGGRRGGKKGSGPGSLGGEIAGGDAGGELGPALLLEDPFDFLDGQVVISPVGSAIRGGGGGGAAERAPTGGQRDEAGIGPLVVGLRVGTRELEDGRGGGVEVGCRSHGGRRR